MGHIVHDAVIVTRCDEFGGPLPDVAAFRASLPEFWRPLVIGPIRSVANGYVSYAFLPDGSKSGWDTDQEGVEYRERFVDLFSATWSDGTRIADVAGLRFGGDSRDEVRPAAEYLPSDF